MISKQSSTTFSDKEQVCADNAASSPFFGRVYVCWASFRSQEQGQAFPTPLTVARSADGGVDVDDHAGRAGDRQRHQPAG